MLLYHNRNILPLLFSRHGSIIGLRSIVLGTIIASFTFFLAYLIHIESELAPAIPNHYGITLIGGVVSFAIVYRMNLGWQRYWDAIAQQHFMYSKWADVYSQFFAFCQVTIASAKKEGGVANEKKIERVNECLDRVERNFGLLSAMSAHRLTCGDNEIMERRAASTPWEDHVMLRQELRICKDRSGGTSMPALSDYEFHLRKSMSQNLLLNRDFVYRIKTVPTVNETVCLSRSKDRVAMVMYWIIHDLSKISGDLAIATPIQSRMYQELSNGMLGFNNSLKVADVPFPFPYANLLTWMLIAFSGLIPFYIATFTTSLILSPIAALFAFVGMWSVNEVAIELENPFGADANDISCGDFHERFLDILIEQRAARDSKMDAEEDLERKKEDARIARLAEPKYLRLASTETSSYLVANTFGQANQDLGVLGAGEVVGERQPATLKNEPVAPPILDVSPRACNEKSKKLATTSEAFVASTFASSDIGNRLFDVSNAIEFRLTEILTELKMERSYRSASLTIDGSKRL